MVCEIITRSVTRRLEDGVRVTRELKFSLGSNNYYSRVKFRGHFEVLTGEKEIEKAVEEFSQGNLYTCKVYKAGSIKVERYMEVFGVDK